MATITWSWFMIFLSSRNPFSYFGLWYLMSTIYSSKIDNLKVLSLYFQFVNFTFSWLLPNYHLFALQNQRLLGLEIQYHFSGYSKQMLISATLFYDPFAHFTRFTQSSKWNFLEFWLDSYWFTPLFVYLGTIQTGIQIKVAMKLVIMMKIHQ